MRPVEQESPSEGLMRIQNEISEVEKREIELRNEHSTMSPRSSTGNMEDLLEEDRSTSPQNVCMKDLFRKNKIIEPQPKPQLLAPPALTRALSQPQLFHNSPVKINSPHRGIMAKFIASRGKLNVNQVNHASTQQQPNSNNFKKNLIMAPIEFNNGSIKAFHSMEKAAIERDTKGRPIRRGYIPVEEKIQCELRDLKNRENELKRLHGKMNSRDEIEDGSSSDEDDDDNDDDDDSVVNQQQQWSPLNGKLSRSIDALNNPSPSPTSDAHRAPIPQPRGYFIRPAVSLAALCDLGPESETPSSHKLIERWESIIQENQQREKSYIH